MLQLDTYTGFRRGSNNENSDYFLIKDKGYILLEHTIESLVVRDKRWKGSPCSDGCAALT